METHASPKADLYVSRNGNDAWSGTLPEPNAMRTDGPLATIAAAQNKAREIHRLQPARHVKVFIRGGTYYLQEPITFTPEDSRTVYAAYPGENPLISGGCVITGWDKEKDGIWSVIIPEVKDGTWSFNDLYVNGVRRTRPRLPKEGFFHIEKSISKDIKDAFIYPENSIKNWHNLEDVELVIFNAWDELRMHIKHLDESNRIVTLTGSNNWPFEAWGQGSNRFYVENVFEALNKPGEWYLDKKSGVLYYHPIPGEHIDKVEVIAPVTESLIIIKGDAENQNYVRDLELKGLTFCYTGWHLPPQGHVPIQAEYAVGAAITAEGAISCAITDCEFTHLGKYAIHLGRACRDNKIARNHIHDMGAGGIKIGLPTSQLKDPERTESNEVTGNHIHDLGKTYLCAVGIWIGGSAKNHIAHNHIHDLFYTGISVGWTWGYGPSLAYENIIEYNHIHDIGKGLLSDMGGIYTLGVSPGTVLRYNLIHDVVSYSYGGWGIYFDEGSTGILAENNIVYNTKSGGFHQHYGKENIVRNNIFAFSKEAQLQRSRAEDHLSFAFERNIVYWREGTLLHGNWSDRNFRMDYNVYWNTSGVVELPADWHDRGFDTHSVIADPLFVNPNEYNFRLRPNSPAFQVGFKQIEGAGK